MVQSHRLGDCWTVESHLLEPQISNHINCIRQSYTDYFCWLEVGFSRSNGMSGQYECFKARFTCCMAWVANMSVSRLTLPVVWQLETQRTSTDKASITTKVKPSIEMSCWVQHVQGTKLWLMVVHILVLARLSDLGARGCIAHQWQVDNSTSIVMLLSVSTAAGLSLCHTSWKYNGCSLTSVSEHFSHVNTLWPQHVQ